MIIKNGIHFEELFNAATHCAPCIYTIFVPMFWKELGIDSVVCLAAHIPVMMHLIGWQTCSNQLNDRQIGSEHSCTVPSKPIV